uniref:FAD-binding protein n=1 Tax=candidate division WOR-3 bacterium TaxID=2052148 RepID=A0A7C2K625_UNCW3
MEYRYVFQPIKIGNIWIKNRIELGPALPALASVEGTVTREMVAYYKRLAKGGAGIITIGESPIDAQYAGGHGAQLNLGDDKVIPGLFTLAEEVHKFGAWLSIELNHRGRQKMYGEEVIAPSSVPPNIPGRTKVKIKEMTQEDIDKVIEGFASAAERCVKAGIKMILLHGAHGHLIAQFLSPLTNRRIDHYGGNLENRARFALEVLDAIRKKVGDKLVIEFRLSAHELVPGGIDENEAIEFAKMIEDKIDLLQISCGIMSDMRSLSHMIRSTYSPYMYNVEYAAKFKKVLKKPISVVGSIMDLDMAEQILKEGKADIVVMVRALLADPELVNKGKKGEKPRPCLRCNTCLQLTAHSFPIRCSVNPTLGRELEYSYVYPAFKRKKVIVIGGGPAGMQAALTAAERGHEVIIYEKEKELGGNLRLAAGFPFKRDMQRFLEWITEKVRNDKRIDLRLSKEATPEVIKEEKPDVLIVAIGGKPKLPSIKGIDGSHVLWVGDLIKRKETERMGREVVIIGGGLTGCEAALYLAELNKNVTVCDMLKWEDLFNEVPRDLIFLLQDKGVKFLTEVKLWSIENNNKVILQNKNWEVEELFFDTLVLSLGFESRINEAMRFSTICQDFYVIGDCKSPGKVMQAIHDGFNVAFEI